MCALTAEIKKSMSSIKKKKRNKDKIMLLANAFEFFNSKTLIDIIHEEFVSINAMRWRKKWKMEYNYINAVVICRKRIKEMV